MEKLSYTIERDGWLTPNCPHKSPEMVGRSRPSIGSFLCVGRCAHCKGHDPKNKTVDCSFLEDTAKEGGA